MKNVYFKEIIMIEKMTEREVLLYIQGFLRGISHDDSLLNSDILFNWDEMITSALFGVSDEN